MNPAHAHSLAHPARKVAPLHCRWVLVALMVLSLWPTIVLGQSNKPSSGGTAPVVEPKSNALESEDMSNDYKVTGSVSVDDFSGGGPAVVMPLQVPYVMGSAVSEHVTPLDKKALAAKPALRKQIESEGKDLQAKGLTSHGLYLMALAETDPAKAAQYLQSALAITPYQQELYPALAASLTQVGDAAKLKEACMGWYKLQNVSRLQLSYAYNVLQSVGPNGVLIVDDEPAMHGIWLVQQTENIRPDVQVISLELARQNTGYLLSEWSKIESPGALGGLLPEPYTPAFAEYVLQNTAKNGKGLGVYYALTLDEPPAAVKDKLYLVGLAYAYSPTAFDNVALLRRHVEQDFRLDDLTLQWYETQTPANNPTLRELALRYTVPLVLLYQHYTLSNEPQKAMRLGQLITKLGNATGQTQNLLPLMAVPANK